MTCKACSHEFCWLCMQKFTADHYRFNPTNPCGGRMFTQTGTAVARCSMCCLLCYGLTMFLLLPVIAVLLVIFILPIYYFMDKYGKIRRQTRSINQMHPNDNRFAARDRSKALKQVGMCNLLLYTLLSIVLSPLSLVLSSFPLLILLCFWLFSLVFVVYKYISLMCQTCGRPRTAAAPNRGREPPIQRVQA